MTDPGRTVFHLLVADPGRGVLVRDQGTGRLAVPRFDGPDPGDGLEPILVAVATILGSAVPVLRIASLALDPDRRATNVLVEAEVPPAPGLADGCTWRPLDEVSPESLVPPEAAGAVGRWLAEQRSGPPDARRPGWARPGFFARASAWMVDRLAADGTPAVAPPRLHSLWCLSAMVLAETARGAAYLKACAPAFRDEPAITAAVDRVTPGLAPSVVAVDDVEGWLLMRDAGGTALGGLPPERWADGLDVLGQIQRAWPVSDRAIALEDRGPERLAASIPGLVEHPLLDRLPDVTRDRLRRAVPRLLDACEQLARLGPPPTIVHGDFHPWNVQASGDRLTIIDWSDGFFGHPFLDLVTYLGRTREVPARRVMLARYLDGWSAHARRAVLEDAAMLALPLGAMHQVESYRRILESLGPDDRLDLDGAAASYGSRALAWLEAGLDAETGS